MRDKNSEYPWEEDIRECYYESPAYFLWFYILNGCGCGSSDNLMELAWQVFVDFAEDREEEKLGLYDKPEREILAHWLDSKGLIEHGTSIRWSWLTEDGKELLRQLKAKPSSGAGEKE